MQEKDAKFKSMIDSCKYNIVVNNYEEEYVKEYKLINNGCVKIVYPRNDYYGCKWDTAIICGNYGITKRY
jgi:hypothetical protein